MAAKKVEKTGVYRAKDGHAVYLHEGTVPNEAVLENYEFDAAATKEFFAEPKTNYFSTTLDAPQDQKAEDTWSGRAISGAPENKAMSAPAENRTDAALADDAAKGTKK